MLFLNAKGRFDFYAYSQHIIMFSLVFDKSNFTKMILEECLSIFNFLPRMKSKEFEDMIERYKKEVRPFHGFNLSLG